MTDSRVSDHPVVNRVRLTLENSKYAKYAKDEWSTPAGDPLNIAELLEEFGYSAAAAAAVTKLLYSYAPNRPVGAVLAAPVRRRGRVRWRLLKVLDGASAGSKGGEEG